MQVVGRNRGEGGFGYEQVVAVNSKAEGSCADGLELLVLINQSPGIHRKCVNHARVLLGNDENAAVG